MKNLVALLSAFLVLATMARAEEPAAGKQVEQELKVGDKTIPFLLYLPKDFKKDGGQWPFMLFLHGRGESSGPLSLVKKWGPPRLADRGESFPYIIASPQCPVKESWAQPGQQELLVKLIEHIEKNYAVDENRVYLTGLSMGGYGSWRLAADHPELFAAVAPVCGGGKPEDADKLAQLPIWVWHGAEDAAVPVQKSIDMVEAIKKAGGTKIRFTTLEHIGHNSWEAAYATPELYQWFDKQSKKAAAPQQ